MLESFGNLGAAWHGYWETHWEVGKNKQQSSSSIEHKPELGGFQQ